MDRKKRLKLVETLLRLWENDTEAGHMLFNIELACENMNRDVDEYLLEEQERMIRVVATGRMR